MNQDRSVRLVIRLDSVDYEKVHVYNLERDRIICTIHVDDIEELFGRNVHEEFIRQVTENGSNKGGPFRCYGDPEAENEAKKELINLLIEICPNDDKKLLNEIRKELKTTITKYSQDNKSMTLLVLAYSEIGYILNDVVEHLQESLDINIHMSMN